MARTLQRFLKLLIGATTVALLFRLFIFESFLIVSPSMAPTFEEGDWVFVSKLVYNLHLPFSNFEIIKFRRPRRSEIVVFAVPELGSERFIKRVVGIGGDTIMLRSGQLYVNGKAEIYQKDVSNEHSATWESPHSDHSYQIATQGTEHLDYGPVDVPIDYFFVLSDNRSVSHDSRSWGPIPYSCLKGRVALLWSPKKRTGSWVK